MRIPQADQEQETDQGANERASTAAGCCAERSEVDSLLEVSCRSRRARRAGVFQVDQIVLLQRPQLVQYLVGGVDSGQSKNDQTAHFCLLPAHVVERRPR